MVPVPRSVEVEAHAIPIAFLKAYPFPAFVLRIRATPGHNDMRRESSASLETDLQDTHVPGLPTPRISPPLLVDPDAPNGNRDLHTASPPPIAHRDLDFVHAPMPAYAPHLLVWANDAWTNLSDGCYFRDIVEPHALVAFESWVQSDSTKDNTCKLSLPRQHVTLHLVKTRHVVPTSAPCYGTCPYAFVVITSVQISQMPGTTAVGSLPTPSAIAQKGLAAGMQTKPSRGPHVPTLPPAQAAGAVDWAGDRDPMVSRRKPEATGRNAISSRLREENSTSKPNREALRRGRSAPDTFGVFDVAARRQQAAIQCRDLFKQTDWSKTPLGPVSGWPTEIRTMVEVVLDSPTQDTIWIGETQTMIYNQHYAQFVPHPKSFARPAPDVWLYVWESLEEVKERCMEGEAIYMEDQIFFYLRGERGHFLERYHTWSMLPIHLNDGAEGRAKAIYFSSFNTTDKVIASRRLETSRVLVESLLPVTSTAEYFHTVAQVIDSNRTDLPFAILYSVSAQNEQTLSADTSGTHTVDIRLEESAGVPDDHPNVPRKMSLTVPVSHTSPYTASFDWGAGVEAEERAERVSDWLSSSPPPSVKSFGSNNPGGRQPIITSRETASWPIHKALTTGQCVLVDCSELVKGFDIRQWDVLPDRALVVPILTDGGRTPRAVVIMGLNVCAAFDPEYEDWINILRGHLTASLASVQAFEAQVSAHLESERIERAKSAWLRSAALELRSPITLIAGPLDELLMSQLSYRQRHTLKIAQRNVYRLQQLVSSLLFFGRVEQGAVRPQFVPLDLAKFITSLTDLFRQPVERLRIDFRVEIEPHAGFIVFDPVIIETVLSNLISSTIKASKKGTMTVRVSYTTEHADIAIFTSSVLPEAEFTVEHNVVDGGISSGPTTAGLGLGLVLAKKLLLLHGGSLMVRPTCPEDVGLDKGSAVIARLPLRRESPEVEGAQVNTAFGSYGREMAKDILRVMVDDDDHSSNSGDSSSNTNVYSFAEGLMFQEADQLLLVDDNHEIRDYIKGLFQPLCRVVETPSALEALQLAKQSPPNLILADLSSPQMSGEQFLQELRSDQATRMIPVVFLSSSADDGEAQLSALMAGAEDFLNKPFKPKELLLRVNLHMQMGKKRATLETLFAQREQELAVLSDHCPTGIMRADKNGVVTYANQAFREMGGMSLNEMFTDWTDYVDDETESRIVPLWADTVAGSRKTTHAEWKWRNGRIMSGVFIRLDQVRPGMSGIIGCVTDITYQEEKLLEAERRRVEAEESKHQQELLVDLTSHEIRTPVSAILHCSSLVLENLVCLRRELQLMGPEGFHPTAENLQELEEDILALESIHQCGLVQERIAGDVLSLARIQLDMLSLHEIDIDVQAEAHKVIGVFASEARFKKIDINLDFGPSFEAMGIKSVKTDPVRLGQVVTNLVTNAIRFTTYSEVRQIFVHYDIAWIPPALGTCEFPENASAPPPTQVPEGTPVYLFVSVRDTGPGMNKSEADNLFKRFRQGKVMIHTAYGGSGLGLFICKKITELCRGNIEVLSVDGAGSTFRFWIKTHTTAPSSPVNLIRKQVEALDLSIDAKRVWPLSQPIGSAGLTPRHAPPTSSLATAPEGLPSTLHVLIVDDNLINQTVLRRQIRKAGLTCQAADDGQQALDRIYASQSSASDADNPPFDVVLMDIEMPVMDGLTAVRHVREAEAAGKIQPQIVIALTGNARPGQMENARLAGMDDVVTKPYRLPELLDKMRTAVQARREKADAES